MTKITRPDGIKNGESSIFGGSSFVYSAMAMTAPKHTTIPTISMQIIGSFNKQKAMIDIKNGLVLKRIIIRDNGANGTAKLNEVNEV